MPTSMELPYDMFSSFSGHGSTSGSNFSGSMDIAGKYPLNPIFTRGRGLQRLQRGYKATTWDELAWGALDREPTTLGPAGKP